MHLQPLERFARSERMLVEYILCDDSIDDFLQQRFEFFRSGPHDPLDPHVRHGDGLFSGDRPSRGGPGQSPSFRSAHALAIAGSLPCLQNCDKYELWARDRFLFGQTPVMTEKDFFNVDAIFQLGRSSISKNGYERFLFSRSFHSPPSLKAASPADFA